jgi:hypothetical protein
MIASTGISQSPSQIAETRRARPIVGRACSEPFITEQALFGRIAPCCGAMTAADREGRRSRTRGDKPDDPGGDDDDRERRR